MGRPGNASIFCGRTRNLRKMTSPQPVQANSTEFVQLTVPTVRSARFSLYRMKRRACAHLGRATAMPAPGVRRTEREMGRWLRARGIHSTIRKPAAVNAESASAAFVARAATIASKFTCARAASRSSVLSSSGVTTTAASARRFSRLTLRRFVAEGARGVRPSAVARNASQPRLSAEARSSPSFR
jgi:hypothetical protein